MIRTGLLTGLALFAALSPAQAQRSGYGPCRQGALSLIAMLDAGEQSTPHFSQVARDVIESCGLTTVHPAGPAQIDQPLCQKLALNLLDTIEDGKMNTRAFTQAKTSFAKSCAPG